jgi:multidrug efflux pump subunit AcrA (membrane-fusion protein)
MRMSLVAVPIPMPRAKRVPWMLLLLLALCVIAIVAVALALNMRSRGPAVAGQFYTVAAMDMDITISKDGELAAVNNVDIVSPVEGQNTIIDIAKEGDFVHKGDVVCKFDSSDIERKIENSTLDLQKAQSDLTAAREQKEIQESSNSANLEAANVDLVLARLDLQQYVEGTFPSDLQTARTNVEMAKITVKNAEDDLAQTRSLFSKGFVTAAEVKTAELGLLKAKNDLDQKTTDLTVLEKYTHEKDLTDKRNKVAQAEKKLARTQRENASNLAQRLAALQQCEQSLALRKQQLEHLQEQCADCTMKAPQDGMVVYSSSASNMWGRRDTPIQPGAQVRWQELIIRLPDTSSMKAVCRINEQQVSKLHVDPNNPIRATVNIVGVEKPVGAWLSNISIMADSGQRWWSPDSKDYPVDITLDTTPAGLKPGVSVQVKLFIDRLRHVLAVPLGAVYAAGADNYVFLRGGAGQVRPVKVSLGQVNETHAQVASGLSAGDAVLVLEAGQGRELLEKAGIKIAAPAATSQPFDNKPPRPPGNRKPNPDARPNAGHRAAAPVLHPPAASVPSVAAPAIANATTRPSAKAPIAETSAR